MKAHVPFVLKIPPVAAAESPEKNERQPREREGQQEGDEADK